MINAYQPPETSRLIYYNRYIDNIVYQIMGKSKGLLFVLGFLFLSVVARAADTTRYRDQLFADVKITSNINYDTNPKDAKAYLADIYQPAGDQANNRPLIIWMHGGAFKFGSKDAKSIQLWCNTFARRGYVCAAINYRLSKKNPLLHHDELLKGCYNGMIDAKKAIQFFRENASKYGIDPERIILAGNSAGGMIAVQTAFVSNAGFVKTAALAPELEGAQSNDLPHIAAVVNLWGAIFNRDWLKNASVPIVCILGDKDGIVPPTHRNNSLFGGIDIHTTADSIHLTNELKVYQGYSHELEKHFNPFFMPHDGTEQRWLDAGEFIAAFLYKNVILSKIN